MLHLGCCSRNRSASDIYYRQARDHCLYIGKYIGATEGICYFKFKVPNKTPVVFRNGSKYDYRFTTKELAKVFQGRFEYIEENSEIYKSFSVPIKKEVMKFIRIVKKVLKLYPSKQNLLIEWNVMATVLSKIVDNLSEIFSEKCRDKKL